MSTGCKWVWLILVAGSLLAQPTSPVPKPAASPKPAAAKAAKPKPPASPAHNLVRQAVEAMGGEDALRAIKSIEWEYLAHRYAVEESERPEGPHHVSYSRGGVLIDFSQMRTRWTVSEDGFLASNSQPATFIAGLDVAAVLDGERFLPAGVSSLADAAERMEFGPERVLLSALDASDLTIAGEETFQGVLHQRLTFTKGKTPVALLLNGLTRTLAAVDYVSARPTDMMWGVWGDIRFRHRLGLWVMEPGGLVLPRQRLEERNGVPYRSTTIRKISLNPEFRAADLVIPPEVRQLFTLGILQTIETVPLGLPSMPVRELASGIHLIPGRFSAALVRQDDGVVVIEAPISSGHSKKLIEEAGWRGRGAALKAVVSAGDAYPQIGGLREFVAAGVSVYAPALNKSLLERLIGVPRTIVPDTLSQKPRPPQWNWVSAKTAIGKGDNAIELYPLGGANSERALLVYFPAHRFLYASQFFSRAGDGSLFMPAYAGEVIAAVEREKLKVGVIFGAHSSPLAWESFLALYEKARSGARPASGPAPPAVKPQR